MSGTIFTGKSADGSDAQVAGVHDYGNGQWGVTPPEHAMHSMHGIRSSPVARAYNEVMNFIENEGRTIQEEYELVQQKKSQLSRRLRDFVELLIEIEKHNPSGEEKPLMPNE